MFVERFDPIEDDGRRRLGIARRPHGRCGVASIALSPLDGLPRAVALLFQTDDEPLQDADLVLKLALQEFSGSVFAAHRGVRPTHVSWLWRAPLNRFDWLLPTWRQQRLVALTRQPVIMPPYEPRSPQALSSIYPEMARMLGHLETRGLVRVG